MTTLTMNLPRPYQLGRLGAYPVIASDIVYEGAAVGLVTGTGHARPLAAGDRFVGFAEQQTDNSTGAAAAIVVPVIQSGKIQIPVSGAVITDVGQPVYATDDNTFTFSPVGGVYIGHVDRFISAGVVIVAFDADLQLDPYRDFGLREALAASTLTMDAEDTGKLVWATVDTVITLPATATALATVTVINGGAFGTVSVALSPAAADKIMGPNLAGTDNKDIINTKTTAQRGDYITVTAGHADGYVINKLRGIWASE